MGFVYWIPRLVAIQAHLPGTLAGARLSQRKPEFNVFVFAESSIPFGTAVAQLSRALGEYCQLESLGEWIFTFYVCHSHT